MDINSLLVVYCMYSKLTPVKPKFKIGDSVKSNSFFKLMMVITVIACDDYSNNLFARKLPLNVKYKCAWIEGEKVFADYFAESDLISS